MANPNVLVSTSVIGYTVYANVTTVLSNVLQNSSSSNKSLRLISISLAGVDSFISPNVSVGVVRTGVTNFLIANITIPIKSAVIIVGKENNVFIEEGDDLRMVASGNNQCWATVSYEEIM
jgi:hypothetical protein